MRQYAELLRAALTASLVLVAGTAFAGPVEDAFAAYGRGDHATALRLVRPLANQGDAHAQIFLGTMYADGKALPQNYVDAVKWVRTAADHRDASAQGLLGDLYLKGIWGLPQN